MLDKINGRFMRPNQFALIALTLGIALLCGCSKSSGSNANTVVATFTATDTATVSAPASALGSFAFTGPASTVSTTSSTVSIGLNPSGLPLTATVTFNLPATCPPAGCTVTTGAVSLYPGTIAYSGNTAATSNFMGDLYGSTVPKTLADTLPGLRYANFGEWQWLPVSQTTGTYYTQEYAGGTQPTPAPTSPPTTAYTGTDAAIGFNSGAALPNEYIISAGGTAVSLTFASDGTFTGTINPVTGTLDVWTGTASGAFNSLALSGAITPNTNAFTGTVTIPATDTTPIDSNHPLAVSNATITSATVSGMFYGPAANEVSGVYQLTATTSNGPVIINGSFGAKQ